MDDTFIKDSPEWYHHYRIVHAMDTGRQIEGLEFVFVELPKFRQQTMPEKRLQVLWLRYLTEVGEKSPEVSTDLLAQQEVRKGLGVEEVSDIAEIDAEEVLRLSRLLEEFGSAAEDHCAR